MLKPQVAQYRALAESRAGHQTGESDRAEVLNRFYQFFSRHFDDPALALRYRLDRASRGL